MSQEPKPMVSWQERVAGLSPAARARLDAVLAAEAPAAAAGGGPSPAEPHLQSLVAYVEAPDLPGLADELRSHLAARLPEHMLPAAIVRLDRLPRTPNGKVDSAALPAWNPGAAAGRSYVAPRTPVELALAQIWAEVLGVSRVSVDDNFFDLGGDSIRCVQMLTRARARGLSFTLQQVFLHRSIAALAPAVESAPAPAAAEIEPYALIAAADRAALPPGVEDAYPLTRLQAGMLFHAALSPDEQLYCDVLSAELEGRFDLPRLRQAIERLLTRHPVLRTAFAVDGYAEPLQLVYAQGVVDLGYDDISGLPRADQQDLLRCWIAAQRRRGFEWQSLPLLRFHVHLWAAARFQLSLVVHHAILDGWSAATMLAELFQLYTALLEERPPVLDPPPAVRFSDFVALERAAIDAAESWTYWQDALAGVEPMRLPRWPPPAAAGAATGYRWLGRTVPPALVDGLRDLARALGVPIKSLLLAAHVRVLALATGRADVVTGVIAHGRPEQTGAEKVLGLFLNTVPSRHLLAGGSWAELALDAFRIEQEWTQHRRFPLAELQRRLGVELFDTAFNFTHFHVYAGIEEVGGPRVLSSLSAERTNYALLTTFALGGGELTLELQAVPELAAAQLELLAGYYLRALESMIAGGRYELAELLSPGELACLLEWSASGRPAGEETVHALFERRCRREPQAVAVLAGTAELTCGELNAAANRLARELRALGVGPESRVAICLERSPALLQAMLAVLKAGGAYVPLDPAYPRERLASMLRTSGARLLIAEQAVLERLPEHDARTLLLGAPKEPGEGRGHDDLEPLALPGNLAFLIFTSGSTGEPKAVGIEHRSAASFLRWAGEAFSPAELAGVLAATSVCFDLSLFELFAPLVHGGRTVLVDSLLAVPELPAVAAAQVTLINTVPSAIAELLAAGNLPPSVRTVNLAGEALPRDLADRLYLLPHVDRVLDLYGPSEATTYATGEVVERGGGGAPPIGRPVARIRVHVLDPDLGPVPVGAPGEICLGGVGLARGYLGDPVATALAFVPFPRPVEDPGERLYRTGDQARFRPDGRLEYLGRRDGQVKLRGFRIELGEIEEALRRLAGVREAAVALHPGGGGRGAALIAFLVPDADIAPSSSELRERLRRQLPDPMVPAAWVVLERLPRTASGKLERRRLPELAAAAPGALAVDAAARAAGSAPRSATEELVAGVWMELLNLDAVTLEDSFFDLGGHSLLLLQERSRLRQRFGVELSMRRLFQSPTLAALAAAVDQELRTGKSLPLPPLERAPRHEALPLSHAQERLWFLEQLSPGTPFYNLPAAVRLQGKLDVAALHAAFLEVVRRHELLRTVYPLAGGRPVQQILPAPARLLAVVDLADLPAGAEKREAEARRLASQEARRPFQLDSGPLLRTLLVRLAAEEHLLLLTLHHVAGDFWSIELLVSELTRLYEAFAAGRSSPLPPLPLQYADFAAWERRWLTPERLELHLAYWRRQLAGCPPLLELPTDRPRPPVQSHRGGQAAFRLASELAAELRALARRKGVTTFMALLAAFAALLHALTGREDVVVGTDVANRSPREVEGLIGFFVNQLVLRNDLSGNPEFRELLSRVREVALAAYTYQELPFEKLVDGLGTERSLRYAPIFQVKLVLQNLTAGRAAQIPGLAMTMVPSDKGTAQFDLVLNLEETSDGLIGGLEYSSDLFDPETAADLLADFQVLIAAAVRQPEARLDRLVATVNAAREERWGRQRALAREGVRGRLRERREAVPG